MGRQRLVRQLNDKEEELADVTQKLEATKEAGKKLESEYRKVS